MFCELVCWLYDFALALLELREIYTNATEYR